MKPDLLFKQPISPVSQSQLSALVTCITFCFSLVPQQLIQSLLPPHQIPFLLLAHFPFPTAKGSLY